MSQYLATSTFYLQSSCESLALLPDSLALLLGGSAQHSRRRTLLRGERRPAAEHPASGLQSIRPAAAATPAAQPPRTRQQ